VLSVALADAEQLHCQVVLLEVDGLMLVTVVDVEAFDGRSQGVRCLSVGRVSTD
jgi:hypothetical protein